ncbi:PH domain-containing protein [Magnetofaba australis]|nr:PH domain-containing protein [Magnetofaba australis]
MGLLSGLMGNASEVNVDELEDEFKDVLAEGEQIELAFKLIRDLIIFTDFRVIFVDKQGITGKKVEYHSIPYKSVTQFIVETAGLGVDDAEMKIWVSGQSQPIEKEFKGGTNIIGVQRALAAAIRGKK